MVLLFHIGRTSLEKPVGKEEIACNKQFLFSLSVFYLLENFPPFLSNLKFSSANSLSLEGSEICHLGKSS